MAQETPTNTNFSVDHNGEIHKFEITQGGVSVLRAVVGPNGLQSLSTGELQAAKSGRKPKGGGTPPGPKPPRKIRGPNKKRTISNVTTLHEVEDDTITTPAFTLPSAPAQPQVAKFGTLKAKKPRASTAASVSKAPSKKGSLPKLKLKK